MKLSFVLGVFLSLVRTGSGARCFIEKETLDERTAASCICMSLLSLLSLYSGHEVTITDIVQIERCCLSHHGKSPKSWCRTGNDTHPRKLSTMTAHWSFFNIDGHCFCGNKTLCVFGCSYKWQIFPCSMKTSPYLQSETSTHDYHSLAQAQDNSSKKCIL